MLMLLMRMAGQCRAMLSRASLSKGSQCGTRPINDFVPGSISPAHFLILFIRNFYSGRAAVSAANMPKTAPAASITTPAAIRTFV